MNKAQKTKFNLLYQRHVSALQRQGKAERTIDGYSRAIRRITEYFDRNGLQFFFKYVLNREWTWVDIVKPPKKTVLPEHSHAQASCSRPYGRRALLCR